MATQEELELLESVATPNGLYDSFDISKNSERSSSNMPGKAKELAKSSAATPPCGRDETFRVRRLISVHSQSTGSSGSSSLAHCGSNTPSSHHASDSLHSSTLGGQFLEDVEMPSFVTDSTVNSSRTHLVSLSPADMSTSAANTPSNSLLNATLIGWSPLEEELGIGGATAGACRQQETLSEASRKDNFKSTLLTEHLRSKVDSLVQDNAAKFSESTQCVNQKAAEVPGDALSRETTTLSSTVHLPSVAPPGLLNDLNHGCQLLAMSQVNEYDRKISTAIDSGCSRDFQTNIDQAMSSVDSALKSATNKDYGIVGRHGSRIAASETRSSTPQENGDSPDDFFNFKDDVHLILQELAHDIEGESSSNSLLDLERINDELLFADMADSLIEQSLLQTGGQGVSAGGWLQGACVEGPCESVPSACDDDDLDIAAITATLRATGRVGAMTPAKQSAGGGRQLSSFADASSVPGCLPSGAAAVNAGARVKETSVKQASGKVVTFNCDQQSSQRGNASKMRFSNLNGTFDAAQGGKLNSTFDADNALVNGTFHAASGRCDGTFNADNSSTTAVVRKISKVDTTFDYISVKNDKADGGKLNGTFETCVSTKDKIQDQTLGTAAGLRKGLHDTFENARETKASSNSTFNQCAKEVLNTGEMINAYTNPLVGAASARTRSGTFDAEVASATSGGPAKVNSTFNRAGDAHDGTFECGAPNRGVNCAFDGAPRGVNSTFDGGLPGVNVTFDGGPRGGNVTFDGGPRGGNVTFDGGPRGGNVTFDGGARGGNVTFDGGARGGNVTFDGGARGGNATFDGGPRGGNVTFDGGPGGENVTFDGGPRGGNVTFDGGARRGNTTFDGAAGVLNSTLDGAPEGHNGTFEGRQADATYDQDCFLAVGGTRPVLNRSQSMPCTSPDENRLNESVQELCASQSYSCINLMDADAPVLKHILKMPPEQQQQLRALCDSPARKNSSFRQRRSLPSNFSPSCKAGQSPGWCDTARAPHMTSHESLTGGQVCNVTTSTPKPKSVQEILSLYQQQQQQPLAEADKADAKPHNVISNIINRYKPLANSAEAEEKESSGECGGQAAGHAEVMAKLRRHRQQQPALGGNGGVVGGPLKAFHPPSSDQPTRPSSSTPNQGDEGDTPGQVACRDTPADGGCDSSQAPKMRPLLPSFGSFSSIDSERIGSPDAVGEHNLGSTMDSPLPCGSGVESCRTSTPASRAVGGPALPAMVPAATPIAAGPPPCPALSQAGDATSGRKESQLKQRFPLSKPLASVFQQQKMSCRARDLEKIERYNSGPVLAPVSEVAAEPKGFSCSMPGKLTSSLHLQTSPTTAAMDVDQPGSKKDISKGLVTQEHNSGGKTELGKENPIPVLPEADCNLDFENGNLTKVVPPKDLEHGLSISNESELRSCTDIKSSEVQVASSEPSIFPSSVIPGAPASTHTPDGSSSFGSSSGQLTQLRNCDVAARTSTENTEVPENRTPSRILSPTDPRPSSPRSSSGSVLSSPPSNDNLFKVEGSKTSCEPKCHDATVLLSSKNEAVDKNIVSTRFDVPNAAPQNSTVDVTRCESNVNSLAVSHYEIEDIAVKAKEKLEPGSTNLHSTAKVEIKSQLDKRIIPVKKVPGSVRTSVASRPAKINQQFGLSKATSETSVSASGSVSARAQSSVRRRALTAIDAQQTPDKSQDEFKKPVSDTAKQNMKMSRASLLAKKPATSSTSALDQGQKRVPILKPRSSFSAKNVIVPPATASGVGIKIQGVIKTGHQVSASATSNALKPNCKPETPNSKSSTEIRSIAPASSKLSTRHSLLPQSHLRKPASGLPRMSLLPHTSSLTTLNENPNVLRPSLGQIKPTLSVQSRNNPVQSRVKSGAAICRNATASQVSPTLRKKTGLLKAKCDDKENNPPTLTPADIKPNALPPQTGEKSSALASSAQLSSISGPSGRVSTCPKSDVGDERGLNMGVKTGVPTLMRPPAAGRGIPRLVSGASGLPVPSRLRMPSIVKK